MTSIRHIWTISAVALTLMLGACSTPVDLNAPELKPQFGTAENDVGTHVDFLSTGRIYSLSKEYGHNYTVDEDYAKVLLRRFDGSGKVVWTRTLEELICDPSGDYGSCQTLSPRALKTNSQGYTFALYSDTYDGVGDCSSVVSNFISKRNAMGYEVAKIYLPINGRGWGESETQTPAFMDSIGMTADGSGNIYVGQQKADFDEDYCQASRSNIVSKYSSAGTLLWQRISTVGVPIDITVSSSGSVYVVGDKGMARYSNSGNLTWTKPGNFEQVMISGANIYTRYRKDIRKYDGTGKQLWYRAQGGLKTLVLQDMVGDGNGNVYLSGKYEVSGPDWNAMTRKLNSSGSVLWTKAYGTSGYYDDAKGIATINGNEIYTTGLTRGSLAHTNVGGEDGYFRKMNSTGNPLWMR